MVCSIDFQDHDNSKDGNKAIGTLGEGFARGYLKRKGYRIIQSPFNCKSGEIDIIAMDGDTLVFVEVKTRQNLKFGLPIEAVTPTKQRQLGRVAKVYLAYFNRQTFKFCRFDVLGIEEDRDGIKNIEHIENAFMVDA